MKALAVNTETDRFDLIDTELPDLPQGGALLRVEGCGLCGSDVDKLKHRKVPSGSILGHEVVGRIEAICPTYEGPFAIGQRIVSSHHVPCQTCHYCLSGNEPMCRTFKQSNFVPGGFAEVLSLSAGHLAHTAFAIPSHISNREAACIEPLACVHRAVRRLPAQPNGSAAVVGLGFVGLLTAQLLKLKHYRVLGLDLKEDRRHLSQVAGYCDSAADPTVPSTLESFLEKNTQSIGAVDVVALTVVNEATIQQALQLVRDGGTLLVLSAGMGKLLDPSVLYFREITVLPSYSPCLEDMQAAAKLVFDRGVQLTPLITHPLPMEQANEGLASYLATDALKVFYQVGEH